MTNDAPTQPVSTRQVTVVAATGLNRLERGRDLTRAEIDDWLADHEPAVRRGTAGPGLEIAAQLRAELQALETIALGSFDERLASIAQALALSDVPIVQFAGKLVESAVLFAREP